MPGEGSFSNFFFIIKSATLAIFIYGNKIVHYFLHNTSTYFNVLVVNGLFLWVKRWESGLCSSVNMQKGRLKRDGLFVKDGTRYRI